MRDRLTERLANGGVGYSNGEYFRVCYPWNDHCLTDIDRIAIKLCELEDKIEQGKIVEMPCKVGDTLYVVSQMRDKRMLPFINSYEVTSITIKRKSMTIYHEMDGFIKIFKQSDFGKTVFLTREEAEKAIEERREE